MKKLIIIAGIFCLACSFFPAVLFGILNFGVLVLFIAGAILVALPFFWDRISKVKPLRNFVALSAGVVLVYSVTVSAMMLGSAYFNPPPGDGKAAVIVLGSKVNGDQPSLMLRRRLNVAYRYLDKNPDAICIVTGGMGADEQYPEAFVMKKYLISLGIDEIRIIEEAKSTSTLENIKFAAALMPDDEMAPIVATDGFHQLRASLLAKSEGLDTYGLSSSTPWGLLPSYWVRDMFGVSVAWLQTR